jgi:hypothetical protein
LQKRNEWVIKYLYPDFGSDFWSELVYRKLANFDMVKYNLSLSKMEVQIDLPKAGIITVNIMLINNQQESSQYTLDEKSFYSDLADAIINTLNKANIKVGFF